MKTHYYTATSLDGFIATLDDPLEWLFPLGRLEDTDYPRFIREVGAIAMGAATYEWMLRNSTMVADSTGAPWPYKQPTWVFTHRTQRIIGDADVRFVHGDVRPVHEAMQLAAKDKNIWLVGGGDLIGQFYDAKLLDEIIVQVGSVTLGAGKPLLPRRIVSPSLRLLSAECFGPGFAGLRYAVEYGA